MTEPAAPALEVSDLAVRLGQREVLRRIGLVLDAGECCVVLGCADAGKSVLLRALAGLDPVVAGRIRLDGAEVRHRSGAQRHSAILLQSFPLWPHMTVGDNVAFALRRRGLARATLRKGVSEALAAVGLADFVQHRPWQLNPAQQQRVALARTLAADARIHLLDEPLSAQDFALHAPLLQLLRRRRYEHGSTLLVATREPAQAMVLADRLLVLRDGEAQQFGTPQALYDAPVNRHVAEYLGPANLLDGEVEYAGDQPLFRTANGILIPLFDQALIRPRRGLALFRPQHLRLERRDDGPFGDRIRFAGRVVRREFLGATLRLQIELNGVQVAMDLQHTGGSTPQVGEVLPLTLDPTQVRILEN